MVDYGSTNYGNEDQDEKWKKRKAAADSVRRTVGKITGPIKEFDARQQAQYQNKLGNRSTPLSDKQLAATPLDTSGHPGQRRAIDVLDTSGRQRGPTVASPTTLPTPAKPVAPTVAPGADPTIESETTAPTGQVVPYYSGQSKRGTGAVLATNTQGNPAGELVGNVSSLRRQPQAGTQSSKEANDARSRFYNAVQPGGRGRSARRPGIVVQQPQRQPTVQEEIGPLNTLGDYIREGAKLKARKTQSDITEARDRTKEAQARTDIDRRKAETDAQGVPDENRERRARAGSYEADTKINTIKADLYQQLQEAQTPEERAQIAQNLQAIEANAPKAEKSTAMTEYQKTQVKKDVDEKYAAWKNLNPNKNTLTYEQWLDSDEGSQYKEWLGGGPAGQGGGGGERPPLPEPGTPVADGEYTAGDGRAVEVKGNKFRYLDENSY